MAHLMQDLYIRLPFPHPLGPFNLSLALAHVTLNPQALRLRDRGQSGEKLSGASRYESRSDYGVDKAAMGGKRRDQGFHRGDKVFRSIERVGCRLDVTLGEVRQHTFSLNQYVEETYISIPFKSIATFPICPRIPASRKAFARTMLGEKKSHRQCELGREDQAKRSPLCLDSQGPKDRRRRRPRLDHPFDEFTVDTSTEPVRIRVNTRLGAERVVV
jgi:hypothetical protein